MGTIGDRDDYAAGLLLRNTLDMVRPGRVPLGVPGEPAPGDLRAWMKWHRDWQGRLLRASGEVTQWIAEHNGEGQLYLDQAADAVEQLRVITRLWAAVAATKAGDCPELRAYADWALGWCEQVGTVPKATPAPVPSGWRMPQGWPRVGYAMALAFTVPFLPFLLAAPALGPMAVILVGPYLMVMLPVAAWWAWRRSHPPKPVRTWLTLPSGITWADVAEDVNQRRAV